MTDKHPAPGRPRHHENRTTTAIRFSPETHAALAQAALERDVSMNWLVERAVAQFIAHLIPVEEMKWTRDD